MDNVFDNAVIECAAYYTAGMDSAFRHAIKGDINDYYEKMAKQRTNDWRRGYCFARNNIAKKSCDLSVFRRGMFKGMSKRDADNFLLFEFGILDAPVDFSTEVVTYDQDPSVHVDMSNSGVNVSEKTSSVHRVSSAEASDTVRVKEDCKPISRNNSLQDLIERYEKSKSSWTFTKGLASV